MKTPNFRLYDTQATTGVLAGIAAIGCLAALIYCSVGRGLAGLHRAIGLERHVLRRADAIGADRTTGRHRLRIGSDQEQRGDTHEDDAEHDESRVRASGHGFLLCLVESTVGRHDRLERWPGWGLP